MKLRLPDRQLLSKTNDVDYYYWNYQFPIKYIQRYRFKSILKLMDADIYDNLLEIGTGSGIFLKELSTHCRQLYAIDIHDKIECVQQFCDDQQIDSVVTQCSIERTIFPDEFFDAIIGISVLEFVCNLRSAINEIKRIMKPGGIFVTICPQKSFLLDWILSFFTDKSPDDEFINSRAEISPMLENSFKVIKKRFYPPILGRLMPVYHSYKLGK
jgi:ubiquinone/menaquinone biosynthesis C-methylase UbiE